MGGGGVLQGGEGPEFACTLTYALSPQVKGPPTDGGDGASGFRMWDWRANRSESKLPGALWGQNEQFVLLRVGLGGGSGGVVVAPPAGRVAEALRRRQVPHETDERAGALSVDTEGLEAYVGGGVCDDLRELVRLVVSSQTKPGGSINSALPKGGWSDDDERPELLPIATVEGDAGYDMPLQLNRPYPLASALGEIKASLKYLVGGQQRTFAFQTLRRSEFRDLPKLHKEKHVVVTAVSGPEFEFRIVVKDHQNRTAVGLGSGLLRRVSLSPLPFPLVRTKVPMPQQYALARDFAAADFLSGEMPADLPPSTLLAWKMGAGKTWGALNQVLCGAAAPPRFLFIVAPSNLVGSWLTVLNGTVAQRAGTATAVYLMGKEHAEDKFFARDPEKLKSVMERSVVVMDEVQYFKHADRTWDQLAASPFYQNIHNAMHRVFLTGTPLQNDMDDTKGLMALLACGTSQDWPWNDEKLKGWDDEVRGDPSESDGDEPEDGGADAAAAAERAQIWRRLPAKSTQKAALSYWKRTLGELYVSAYDPMDHQKTRCRYPSKLSTTEEVPLVPWVEYEVGRQGSQRERILSIVPTNRDAAGGDSVRGRLHGLQNALEDFVPCPKIDALCDHVWNATARRLAGGGAKAAPGRLVPGDTEEIRGPGGATYLWPKTVYTSYTEMCLPHVRTHMWKYLERVHRGAVRCPQSLREIKESRAPELLVCELQEDSRGQLGLVLGGKVDPKAWESVGDRMHRIHECSQERGGLLVWSELSGKKQGTTLHAAYCEGKVNLMFITDAAQAGTDLNYQDMALGEGLNLNSVSLSFVEPPYNQSKLDQTAGRVFRFSMYDHMFRTVTESRSIVAVRQGSASAVDVLHLMCNAGWMYDNLDLPTSKDSGPTLATLATLEAFASWAAAKLARVRTGGGSALTAERIAEYLETHLPQFVSDERERVSTRKPTEARPVEVDFERVFEDLCASVGASAGASAGASRSTETSDQRIIRNLEEKNERIRPFTDVIGDRNRLRGEDIRALEEEIQRVVVAADVDPGDAAALSQDITPDDLDGAAGSMLVSLRVGPEHPLHGVKGLVQEVKTKAARRAGESKPVVRVAFAHPEMVFRKGQELRVGASGRTDVAAVAAVDSATKKPLPAGAYVVESAKPSAVELHAEGGGRHKVSLVRAGRAVFDGEAAATTTIVEGNPFKDFDLQPPDQEAAEAVRSALARQTPAKKQQPREKQKQKKRPPQAAKNRTSAKGKRRRPRSAPPARTKRLPKAAPQSAAETKKERKAKRRPTSQKKRRPSPPPPSAASSSPKRPAPSPKLLASSSPKRSRLQSGGGGPSVASRAEEDDGRVWPRLPSDPLASSGASSGEFTRLLNAQTEP